MKTGNSKQYYLKSYKTNENIQAPKAMLCSEPAPSKQPI